MKIAIASGLLTLFLMAYFAFAETYSVKNEYSNITNIHSVIVNWNGTNVTIDDPSLVLALDFNNNTRDRSRYGNNGVIRL